MDKERGEGSSSSIQAPWIPQTPVKPIAPIYPKSTEKQSNCHQTEIGMRLEMNDYEHLSFRDLLHLANTASAHLAAQTPWAYTRTEEPASSWGEWSQKGNEAVETSSVSNDVAQQIKTPEKPKRRKHRPKVVREAKPKQAPKKPAADGKESKTPRRKYVRKKPVVGKGQEATPVEAAVEPPAVETSNEAKKICRRALDFQDESFKPENGEDAESAATGKQLDSGNQESKDGLPLTPSTPKERSRQVKRKGKEPENNGSNQGVDLLMPQAAKRRQAKEPPRDINPSGIQYAELRDYQKMNWLYNTNFQHEAMRFAAICSTSFAGQRLHAREDVSKCYNFTSQPNVNRVVTMEEKGKCTLQGGQHFESTVCSDKAGTPIKKRPTGHARFRNLSAINKATEVCGQLPAGGYSRPHNNNNVLVKTRVTLSKKKRNLESGKSRTNKKTVLPNLLQYPASLSASIPPDEIWKRYFSIEAITEKLGVLDINRETALVPHPMNQMILFSSGAGAIVPLTPVKKRRARAKVDLDNETDKVWKLLMENIDNEGVNGSDEQKAKYWEEERNVFRGRADSFIARMHLVQGDRRFTPWKGSVVDSVVGVFLTQNVSDHLSSSAFMSLAAAFPVPSVPSRNFDVGTSSMTSIRITYLDSEESMSNPPVHNQSSVTLNINIQPDEEKDYETSRSSSEIASSAQESVGKTMDLKGSSVEVDKTNQTYLVQELSPSEDSVLTCQESLVSDAPKTIERAGSSSKGEHYPSFVELLQGLKSSELQDKGTEVISVEDSNQKAHYENPRQEVGVSSNPGSSQVSPNTSPGDCCSEVKEPWCFYQQDGDVLSCQKPECSSSIPSTKTKELFTATTIPDINESTSLLDVQQGTKDPLGPIDDANVNAKGKGKKEAFDWDSLRREAQGREGKREKTTRTMDSVDWEAIRTADVSEVAETIKSRGMNHKLAERIQAFLNRLVTEHESIDLEWLRDVPPDKGKEYLMSFRGLGLKSVECVRLLTLHHLAFPVDTNVGRIAVRLGWVPLQPLPESLQLHLLEMYPVLESIQKYLWPRLCKLDQKTLYELHYQMITFGKVFCTKSKPNCNACPMRGECRHFASAFASARLALPGSEKGTETANKNPSPLHLPEPLQREQRSEVVRHSEIPRKVTCCEPIIEEPASPEPECTQVSMADIEDAFYEDPEEIPTIRLDMDAFTSNLKNIMEHNKELQDGNMSSALVALTAQAASIPMPKLKNISQLRTEHQVYELPDSHPLLAELENREPDDPCSYLLAIWTPGETADSVEPAVSKCVSQKFGTLCDEETCFSCNSVKEARSQTVRGTILIPCRTAMRGSFPLNGTYFQVNEVFADHDSSLIPIDVPRQWLWNLPRRTVYFGTSIPSIFKGLPTETIQQCFWRGYVCVRGFDRKTRGPKPLIARLHFPVSKKKSQGNPV